VSACLWLVGLFTMIFLMLGCCSSSSESYHVSSVTCFDRGLRVLDGCPFPHFMMPLFIFWSSLGSVCSRVHCCILCHH
jgi:hypothetical protein